MYFWRSQFHVSPTEQAFLDRQKIGSLYVKFFDVDLDPVTGQPVPIAAISDLKPPANGMEIIPVVFITQSALRQIALDSPEAMAQKITSRIARTCEAAGLRRVKEWQLDCDWTARDQQAYFRLVAAAKTIAHQHKISLSVTLRLYPFKYRSVMGVPPADKALLMCYNMGNLKNPATNNSILDPDEMEKYLRTGQPYPLPLDAALPLFNWQVWFRDRAYMGLLYPSEVQGLDCLRMEGGRWVFTKDTAIRGRLFLEGDWLRDEDAGIDALRKSRQLLETGLGGRSIQRLALFHLDSLILSKYDPDALEALFGRSVSSPSR